MSDSGSYVDSAHPANASYRLTRLQRVAKLEFSADDRNALKTAQNWRNAIVHAEVSVQVDELKPVFSRLLGFYADFSRKPLAEEMYTFLSGDRLQEALSVKDYGEELMRRAEARLVDEAIEPEWVWTCRQCGFEAFVVQDEINTCYV